MSERRQKTGRVLQPPPYDLKGYTWYGGLSGGHWAYDPSPEHRTAVLMAARIARLDRQLQLLGRKCCSEKRKAKLRRRADDILKGRDYE